MHATCASSIIVVTLSPSPGGAPRGSASEPPPPPLLIEYSIEVSETCDTNDASSTSGARSDSYASVFRGDRQATGILSRP